MAVGTKDLAVTNLRGFDDELAQALAKARAEQSDTVEA